MKELNFNYINYKDLSYIEKRKELRNFYENPIISYCVDTIADEIYSYFRSGNSFEKYNFIKKYLIDGYLAFEKVPLNLEQQHAGLVNLEQQHAGLVTSFYNEVDPTTLIPSFKDGRKVWIQNKKIYSENQIVYISYSSYNSNISYVESLMKPYLQLELMENMLVATLPGLNNKISDKKYIELPTNTSLDFLRENFYLATRIPQNYKNTTSEFMEQISKRYKRFIDKHVQNLSPINKI